MKITKETRQAVAAEAASYVMNGAEPSPRPEPEARWLPSRDPAAISAARDRLDAEDYPATPEGARDWARDGITVDTAYYEEGRAVRTTVLATLRHNGEHDLAHQVEEHWT